MARTPGLISVGFVKSWALMRDLLVLMPSRGRARNVAALTGQYERTCRLATDVLVGIDPDDDQDAYQEATNHPAWTVVVGEARANLTTWTNRLWREHRGEYRFYASLGDDHIPRTVGWDKALVGMIEAGGGEGFSYPNDFYRQETPSAWVVSAGICEALGWVCLPCCGHYYVDNAVRDLGLAAGCIWFQPGVVVEHCHVSMEGGPKAPPDATYREAYDTAWIPDSRAYNRWRNRRPGWVDDVETVRRVFGAARPAG